MSTLSAQPHVAQRCHWGVTLSVTVCQAPRRHRVGAACGCCCCPPALLWQWRVTSRPRERPEGGFVIAAWHCRATARRRRRACTEAAAGKDLKRGRRDLVRGCRGRRRRPAATPRAAANPVATQQLRGSMRRPRARGRCVLTERRAGRASVSDERGACACQTSMKPDGGDCRCVRVRKGLPPVSGGGGRPDA